VNEGASQYQKFTPEEVVSVNDIYNLSPNFLQKPMIGLAVLLLIAIAGRESALLFADRVFHSLNV
jgi:hypothetical protein